MNGALGKTSSELVEALCALGGVDTLDALATAGPLVASLGEDSLFHCLFGRDAIRMAMDLFEDFPRVARATLLDLARLQGVRVHPRAEEEPGRILHEDRDRVDPIHEQAAGRWDLPYYGAIDTTPQWINLLGAYCSRWEPSFLGEPLTDRLGRTVTIRDCLLAATSWILGRLNNRLPGYLWGCRATPRSLINQSWTDSFDAFYFEDGTLFDADEPRAPIEVQGYTHDALLTAASLLESPHLRDAAIELCERVLREFWLETEGTFGLAAIHYADGALRVSRVVASNAGHLMASRILDGADLANLRDRLVARLMAPDLLAGAGIRTKSATAARFRPGAYHNGSTWPMDSGVISDGLRRHGYAQQADDLDERILRACVDAGGFPEFFRGDLDAAIRVNTAIVEMPVLDGRVNRLEQPPQRIQGWTVTRVWRILRSRGAI